MSRSLLKHSILVIAVYFLQCNAGRTHYYGGSGYPTIQNDYGHIYGAPYAQGLKSYGLNRHGVDVYHGYDDYDGYDDEDFDVDHHGYGGYGSYAGYQHPYNYQKALLPIKYLETPVIKEYIAPLPAITKSVSSSSLYQTHPTSYGSYAGSYAYRPKYGSEYDSGFYKK